MVLYSYFSNLYIFIIRPKTPQLYFIMRAVDACKGYFLSSRLTRFNFAGFRASLQNASALVSCLMAGLFFPHGGATKEE